MIALRATVSICIALLVVLGAVINLPGVSAKSVTIVVEMKDFNFRPVEIRVDPGDNVTIRVYNNETSGGVPHTFDLDDFNVHIGTTDTPLFTGENGVGNFTAARNGTFWFHCEIPGHALQSADGSWSQMAGRLLIGSVAPPTPLNVVPFILAGVAAAVVAGVVGLYLARKKK